MPLALATVNPAAGLPLSTRLAHDLRNTLTTVALHLETLERLSGAQGAKAASAAHALIGKAAHLCTDVLQEAAHPDAPPRRAGFDIVTVIRQVVDLVAPIAPEGLALKVRTDGPQMTLGNAQEAFRILFNLAHNAVMVARRTQRMSNLEFLVERSAAMVAVRIADDGPGLPKAVRERLFSRLSGRFATSGNGFGLAIARELAERNGGTLELGEVRSGTSFTLALPALAMKSVGDGPVTRMLGRSAIRI
jgi:signal transduction histidine kinase